MKKGFTLVEIMIVVAIIGLLVAVAVPAFMKNRQDAQGSACAAQLDQIFSAKEQISFKLNLVDSSQGWPGAGAAQACDTYLRGFSLAAGLDVCPGNGTYALGASVVDDNGNVIVPICDQENLDPDGDGVTYVAEGLHIHRRSHVRQADGTFARDAAFAYAS